MPGVPKKKAPSNQSTAASQPAYGARVVIAGLVALVLIFGAALLRFDKAAEVATAVGAVSGIVATLVGAYFGIRGATLAQAQSAEMMAAHGRRDPDPAEAAPPDPAADPPTVP